MKIRKFLSAYWPIVLIAVVYAVVLGSIVFGAHSRGVPFASVISTPGDSQEYISLAETLLGQQRFALSPDAEPEFFRTPGYPALVALVSVFFGSVAALPFVQAVLLLSTTFLIMRIGESVFSRATGIAAALLYAFDPTTVFHTMTSYTEVPFVFLLVLAVYVTVTGKPSLHRAFGIGIVLGALALTRPVGLFITPLILIYVIYRSWGRTAVLSFVAAVLGIALVAVPWMVRNQDLAGHFSLSSISTYNALFYNAVEFTVAREGITRDEAKAALFEKIGTSDLSSLRSFEFVDREAVLLKEYIGAHLPAYAVFHAFKTLPFFLGSSISSTKTLLHQHGITSSESEQDINLTSAILARDGAAVQKAIASDPAAAFEHGFWLMVWALAGAFTIYVLLYDRSLAVTALLFCVLAGAFAVLTGPVSMPRYRLPAEPFVFLLFAEVVRRAALFIKNSSILAAWMRRRTS